ncbi:3-methyl-2-oxobutanoate hydroxymethyltransferase [Candidatus Terasakiella magnetica]|uniref:3-methyl-2-oxobutanoate hydroxymethyltransferase n=1 Tax=Candidatus Terasakiella magnetica TaxID=1867952 RepID=A0A1C3RGU0_9PROT|nr:3-methyl-2-oxobutanoate hydroxymethyltransferase [Candidatus Terasakiella magnetica]SCA56468.1 3-methyl-2-oxobutanoate hydroxymethyltransferase [Candidatus Terasakiella magnetica]
MSKASNTKRISLTDLVARKGAEPIVCLTAYTTSISRLIDDHVDLILVGDSLGMVLYGMDSTLGVTVDMMIAHGKGVMRGSDKACVIVDMPFGSYEESPEMAFRNCSRVMAETRCSGVKLEGGVEMAETINFLVKRGIPVVAHVGLTPQSVHAFGGFKSQGRTEDAAERIVEDAKAVAEAGASAVVVEGVVEPLGVRITKEIDVPTIGIGASPQCDGQILVTEDLIGLFAEFKPKFVKRYAQMDEMITTAVEGYKEEVRARTFPAPEHCFGYKGDK